MATRKRNEWLDDPVSDEDENGARSSGDDLDTRRGAFQSRVTKRRRLNSASESNFDSEEDEAEEAPFSTAAETLDDGGEALNSHLAETPRHPASAEPETVDSADEGIPSDSQPGKPIRSALAHKLAKSAKKTTKSGVIYISRIPPFMKPHTLKHFLAPHAPSGLGRIFLTPESSESRHQRLRSGGNKKQNFIDGWLEFMSKREAKYVAETLNAQTIGGKKGGYYRDDVWNLKYLKGFKWRHLTEQIANENAERSARMRAEDQRERREVREFVKNAERGKMLEGIEEKKRLKLQRAEAAGETVPLSIQNGREPRREFVQVKARSKTKDAAKAQPSADAKRVLSKIF